MTRLFYGSIITAMCVYAQPILPASVYVDGRFLQPTPVTSDTPYTVQFNASLVQNLTTTLFPPNTTLPLVLFSPRELHTLHHHGITPQHMYDAAMHNYMQYPIISPVCIARVEGVDVLRLHSVNWMNYRRSMSESLQQRANKTLEDGFQGFVVLSSSSSLSSKWTWSKVKEAACRQSVLAGDRLAKAADPLGV